MSEATRRFIKLPEGTMHESAHGDWVRYGDLAIAIQRAEAAEAEAEALRKYLLDLLAVVHRDGGHHTEAVGTRQSVVDAEIAFHALRQRAEAAEAERDEMEQQVLSAERNALAVSLQLRAMIASRYGMAYTAASPALAVQP